VRVDQLRRGAFDRKSAAAQEPFGLRDARRRSAVTRAELLHRKKVMVERGARGTLIFDETVELG
jgi:hypothetical protein